MFLGAFGLAALGLLIPPQWSDAVLLRGLLAAALVFIYFIYVLLTLRSSAGLVESGHATEAHKPAFLNRLGLPDNLAVVLLQLALGLAILVAGAKGFIFVVHELSDAFGVSALLLSLLIIPVATELPENVNSVLWIRRRKDTLAIGNITGAMVFQGTTLPALGLLLTPWQAAAAWLWQHCGDAGQRRSGCDWLAARKPEGSGTWPSTGSCICTYIAIAHIGGLA